MPSPSPDRPGGGPIRSRRSNSRALSVATIAAEGFSMFSLWLRGTGHQRCRHDDDDGDDNDLAAANTPTTPTLLQRRVAEDLPVQIARRPGRSARACE